MAIRVMTYNIKGHGTLFGGTAHLEAIAKTIVEANVDVVGLQEVHRGGWKARFHDQAAELERLTGMQMCFGRAMAKGSTEYGNAILTRGRITGSRIEPLPGPGEPRALLVATVDVAGERLHAHVTHLAAWGRFGARTRLAQARAVAKFVEASERPFLLTGDFNSSPTSEELRAFHEGDLVLSCFLDPIVTHRATRQCLDYIFVDPGWQVRTAEVLRQGPSDHWPLVAELTRENGGPPA